MSIYEHLSIHLPGNLNMGKHAARGKEESGPGAPTVKDGLLQQTQPRLVQGPADLCTQCKRSHASTLGIWKAKHARDPLKMLQDAQRRRTHASIACRSDLPPHLPR